MHYGLFENEDLPTSKTQVRMGTTFGRSGFWGRLGGQTVVMIGRWYSRQPLTRS